MKKVLLILILIIVAGIIGFFGVQNNTGKGKMQITSDINKNIEIYKETPDSILVDVRTREEYADGYIEDSVNIPLDEINNADFDKDKIIFVYCKAGRRAQNAAEILTSKGYRAYNIGGIDDYNGITVR